MSRLILKGATSGTTELAAAAVAGDNTLTLPANNGSAHQLLKMGATAGELAYGGVSLTSGNDLGGVAAMNGSPVAGLRNAIINGNFDIWQRGTSFSNPATASYTADRWVTYRAGTSASYSRQSFALGQTDVPGEPTYFFRAVITSSAGAGNNALMQQRIEGVRTFAGQQVTVSFWAKADAPKQIAVELEQDFGTGGSPSAIAFAISPTKVMLDTSWRKITHTTTVPPINGKTLGSNNNDMLALNIWFDSGANHDYRTDNLGQQSGTFDIAQVQLELGPVATPFERRPIGMELELCQRYYERCYATIVASGWVPIESFVTPKRVVPSLAIVSYVVGSGGGIAPYGFRDFVAGSYATVAARVILAGDAEL